MSSRRPDNTILLAHPSAELYGSDRVLLESVSALVDAGWRVVVTLPTAGPLVAELAGRGASVVRCRTPVLRKSARRPLGMLRLMGISIIGFGAGLRVVARERPRALYVNTMTIPLWPLLGWLCRVPVLSHVHEGEASASRFVRTVLTIPLFFSRKIVANSQFSADVLTSVFPRLRRRTSVVYNGIPGPPTNTPARSHLTEPVQLTYLGRLSPRKGVDVAIDALTLLADRGITAELDVVGGTFPGYEWYERQLRAQVSNKQLGDQVRFHGFQPSVWELVTAADVVLVPSRADEPFGDTVVEAILSGRPVIASATSGLLEATAGYHNATTVEPGSAPAIADALVRQIQNWENCHAAADDDIAIARSRHEPHIYREQIARQLSSIAKPHH